MGKIYQQFAGRNLDRLCALSDGLFAIAMTILVLDLRIPTPTVVHESHLWSAILALWHELIPYFMSFMTLGIFWVGQQSQLNTFAKTDRDLTWIHIAFLCAVSLMPWSTMLLAGFMGNPVALFVYWFNILILGVILYAALAYAKHAGLFKDTVTAEMLAGQRRRITIAQALYALGAALCLVPGLNTYWSIGFIVLVQLIYAIAPRVPILDRL